MLKVTLGLLKIAEKGLCQSPSNIDYIVVIKLALKIHKSNGLLMLFAVTFLLIFAIKFQHK